MSKVHVIGIGFRPVEKRAAEAVLQSDDVLVNNRLLDVFKGYAEYKEVKDKIIVHASVYETLDYIADNYEHRNISLLAAGDPMFFGIGRLVVQRLGREAVEVYPDLSSIQIAFSRVRETSNNALFISLHGSPDPTRRRKMEHEITDLPGLLDKHEKIAILTDKINNPSEIAKILNSSAITRHSLLSLNVCEKLGYPDEKIIEGTSQEISKLSFKHPNVVIIVNDKSQTCRQARSQIPRFGLKEDEIQHSNGLITKDEVRAVTIHKLRLPEKGVFWDIGAGSGSVSIEAARLYPHLRVVAVEKNRKQVDNIRKNINKYDVHNLEIIDGAAPEALENLPEPQRVFIGGSGGSLRTIVNTVAAKMASGIFVINATTIETLNEAVQSLKANNMNTNVSEVSISRSKSVGDKLHMSALNPIFIVKGEKNHC